MNEKLLSLILDINFFFKLFSFLYILNNQNLKLQMQSKQNSSCNRYQWSIFALSIKLLKSKTLKKLLKEFALLKMLK